MAGTFGVVENEPIGEFLVEVSQIGEEWVFVVVDEGFLDRAVKAFGVGAHFRSLKVGKQTVDLLIREGLGEAPLNSALLSESSQHLRLLRE